MTPIMRQCRLKRLCLVLFVVCLIISTYIMIYSLSNLPQIMQKTPSTSTLRVTKLTRDNHKFERHTEQKRAHKRNDLPHMKQYIETNHDQYQDKCASVSETKSKTDVQMLELYEQMKFDNPNGGVWKQGFPITYNEQKYTQRGKLKVFVVPHSHNDPGWIKTLDNYFQYQTKHILDNMLNELADDATKKFIWAEISYLSMWYDKLTNDKRGILQRIIDNGQLEIVTGGWVMTDEANSHWQSTLIQLTQGHQWLWKHLKVTPKNGWTIDPFGLSPTIAFLLKKSGLDNLVIQRVHYSVKKHLASKRQLEFSWQQLWDETGANNLFTHMMPFYSYDIPHTCGPDPKVCCQFDFKRMRQFGLSCPWNIAPQEITKTNVAVKANQLLDQYRQKAELFRTNVLLVPLGDDFRYDQKREWDAQFHNYQRLFDYMNERADLHVDIQFGTLANYFDAISDDDKSTFATLSGDFFTYADRDDHYWSGYYTSRPFYKRMDRVLLGYIRAAESLATIASFTPRAVAMENLLNYARESLSLFQHHDAVTGTARDDVVVDYARRLLQSIRNCQYILQKSAHVLLSNVDDDDVKDVTYFDVDDVYAGHDMLSERITITLGREIPVKKVFLYNSMTYGRREVVTFIVSTPYVVVKRGGVEIPCQVSPVFQYQMDFALNKFQLAFVTDVAALGLVAYTIEFTDMRSSFTIYPKISLLNCNSRPSIPSVFESHTEISPLAREFSINSTNEMAAFNKLGLLKAIRMNGKMQAVHLEFVKYGVRKANERSGAYLFLPDGQAHVLKVESPIVKVVEGAIVSFVTLQLRYVEHTVTIFNTNAGDGLGIQIQNIVNIATTRNFELAMRVSTNVKSSNDFFTDLNAYQWIRRRRFDKLPLQANYYPMPSGAFIEDDEMRLTIVSSTPLGVASLNPGQLEIMQDRRLMQDDNRGLEQGVMDNHPTKHVFKFLLEPKINACDKSDDLQYAFPTVKSHVAVQTLLNPLVPLLVNENLNVQYANSYEFLPNDIGVDVSVVVFRTLSPDVGLTFHRQHFDGCFMRGGFNVTDGQVNIGKLIGNRSGKTQAFLTSATFMHLQGAINLNNKLQLCAMDLQSVLVRS